MSDHTGRQRWHPIGVGALLIGGIMLLALAVLAAAVVLLTGGHA